MTNKIKTLMNGSYFYEAKSVKRTRKEKNCWICNKSIPSGSSHNGFVLFNDEFYDEAICAECEEKYKKELSELMNGEYDQY